jgi:hypothetical protein
MLPLKVSKIPCFMKLFNDLWNDEYISDVKVGVRVRVTVEVRVRVRVEVRVRVRI